MPQQQNELSEDGFKDWMSLPITQLVFHTFLSLWQESLRQQWGMGNFQAATIEETALANAGAVAQVKLLSDLSQLDYEKLTEVLNDE